MEKIPQKEHSVANMQAFLSLQPSCASETEQDSD